MQSHTPTTPFGRRPLTLAHVATQAVASRRPDKVVHKWQIFRAICTARPKLGVSERALAVLNALLSFYPETTLTGDDELIVFPSNEQLSLRTHGMPASTLRRLLAVLVDADSSFGAIAPMASAMRGRAGEEGSLCFRLRSCPARRAGRGIRGLAREIEAEERALRTGEDYSLPTRHRQDDCDGDRRGRSNPKGRAGAGQLARGPCNLPWPR